jgi:DegV family protein with EDD domain
MSRSAVNVGIVCDTGSDLPSALAKERGIVLVPLHIRFGTTELVDREQVSTEEFWARSATAEELPETSAPSPGAFTTAFESLAAAGADGIVCVTLSSKLSATGEAAGQAARGFGDVPVRVVDSLSVTMGEGMVALAAADAAARGSDLAGVVSAAESARSRLSVYGAIDTLDNLRKGGRIGGAAAALGTLLSIKPVIEVRNGVVEQESRQRTRAKSLRYLAEKVQAAGALERLAVMSAAATDLDQFLELLAGVKSQQPRITGDIGPVIGTHAGPGAIGVAWVTAVEGDVAANTG